MAADLPGQDPRALWKDQEQESDPMTLEQIHALVRRYDNRMRRTGIVIALAMVMVGAVASLAWTRAHDPVMTILFLGGELTACYQLWRLVFPTRDPAEPAGAYLRRRLEIRLVHLQGGWVRAALPLAPCMVWSGYVVSQRHQIPLTARLSPFALIVFCLILVMIRARMRARKIKIELAELDRLLER